MPNRTVIVMPNRTIYLVTEQTESEDKKKSSYTRTAYEDKHRAFDMLNRIVNHEGNRHVKWAFSSDRTHSREIKIVGNGTFFISHEEGIKPEPGTITLTLEEICLVHKEKDDNE